MDQTRDLRRAMRDALEQLDDNVKLYEGGRNAAYQAVAVELRKLLLDGRRGLALRVFPDLRLGELRPSNRPALPHGALEVAVLDSRGTLSLGGPTGASLHLEFLESSLNLEPWLSQWILMPTITIRGLIADAANEEAAHTVDRIGAIIEKANFWKLTSNGREMPLHHVAVVSIGRYIHDVLTDAIASGASS